MTRLLRTWFGIAAASICLAACNATHETPFDKNTNWLERCTDSDQCDPGLQCLCGVCTSVCDRSAQCADLDREAICTEQPVSGSACGDSLVARVCSMSCDDDETCMSFNAQLECVDGECRPQALADAGTGSEGADGGAGGDGDDAGDPFDASVDARPPAGELDSQTLQAVADGCGESVECDALAAVNGEISDLFVGDDGFVYWTVLGTQDGLGNPNADGWIGRIARQGGASQQLISELKRPIRAFVDGDRLYWLTGDPKDYAMRIGTQTLFAAPADGSAGATELRSDSFLDLRVRGGEAFWLETAMRETGPSVELMRFDLGSLSFAWSEFWVPGSVVSFAGLDDAFLYFEAGGRLWRGDLGGNLPVETGTELRLAALSVAQDALWCLHTDSDGMEWIATLSKDGRDMRHVAAGLGPGATPHSGDSVVWTVAVEAGALAEGRCAEASCRWALRNIPKSGGTSSFVFRWETTTDVWERASGPMWIAAGDEAWIFAHGALVRVRAK
jgi:hypothetical protein